MATEFLSSRLVEKDCLCLHCPAYLILKPTSQSSHWIVVPLAGDSCELNSVEVYEAERKGRGQGEDERVDIDEKK